MDVKRVIRPLCGVNVHSLPTECAAFAQNLSCSCTCKKKLGVDKKKSIRHTNSVLAETQRTQCVRERGWFNLIFRQVCQFECCLVEAGTAYCTFFLLWHV